MGRSKVTKPAAGPRILYLDIETSPLLVYTWGLWDQNIGLNQIVQPWGLLSCAWMFEGDREMSYADNRHAPDPRNDRDLVARLWDLLDEADILVTQNGIHFDARRINARFLELGFPPPSSYRHVDTKVEAKRVAALVSNKLEWLAKAIANTEKERHTKFPGFELWAEALKGNPAAWDEMAKYNRQDVWALRAVYLKLRPWMKNHPNLGQYVDTELQTCPKCGSVDTLHGRGVTYTTAGQYQRYRCTACGGWSRGTKNLFSKPKRTALVRGD